MNRLMLPAALVLSASVFAQGFLTTPPGGLPKEGPHYAYLFGWYADARYQQVDGNHVGNKAYTITDIAFRMDNDVHTPDTGMGRTWTRITLDVSETSNYQNLSKVWKHNITHSTSRVFDNKWSWPTMSGLPLLEPDVWGGSKGQLRFPFEQPWVYSGKREFVMDYTFRGGQLANAAVWTGGQGAIYNLDTEHFYPNVRYGSTRCVPPGFPTCADSANTEPVGATTYAFALIYDVQVAAKQLVIGSYTTGTGKQPVVQAWSLRGSNTGVDVGAKCNRFYLDLNRPFLAVVPSNVLSMVPWQGAYAGLKLWAQTAWADSQSQQFSLTSVSVLTLPWAPPPSSPPRYKTLYNPDPDSLSSVAEPVTVGYYFPFTRYGIK